MSTNSPSRLCFTSGLGELRCGDSLQWLTGLSDASVELVVADPPYGIGKAEWDTFESRQEYVLWARTWLEQDIEHNKVLDLHQLIIETEKQEQFGNRSCSLSMMHELED